MGSKPRPMWYLFRSDPVDGSNGYSLAFPDGRVSRALILSNWRLMAHNDGADISIHSTEDAARAAWAEDSGGEAWQGLRPSSAT